MSNKKFSQWFEFKNESGQTYVVNQFIDSLSQYECCHEQCSCVKFYTHEQIVNFLKNEFKNVIGQTIEQFPIWSKVRINKEFEFFDEDRFQNKIFTVVGYDFTSIEPLPHFFVPNLNLVYENGSQVQHETAPKSFFEVV